jgi:hypothetical protein
MKVLRIDGVSSTLPVVNISLSSRTAHDLFPFSDDSVAKMLLRKLRPRVIAQLQSNMAVYKCTL